MTGLARRMYFSVPHSLASPLLSRAQDKYEVSFTLDHEVGSMEFDPGLSLCLYDSFSCFSC
jgi:hypothetical protein